MQLVKGPILGCSKSSSKSAEYNVKERCKFYYGTSVGREKGGWDFRDKSDERPAFGSKRGQAIGVAKGAGTPTTRMISYEGERYS